MREILFRGKRLGNGEWVEGFYVERQGKQWIYPSGDPVISRSLARELRPMHSAKSTQKIMREVFPADPATVGQYTGLTDKNGKRIFEGDVIECWSEGVRARGTVQQNRGGLWIIYPAWQKLIMWGLCPNEDGSTDVEIIGNIHDNPELLEGGEG